VFWLCVSPWCRIAVAGKARAMIVSRRRPTRGSRKARNLLFAMLGLALAGVAWIAMALLAQQFQAARCPQDAFFWASNQVPTALQIVPLLFPALGVGFLTANWLIASIPGGRDFFNQSRKPGHDHVGEQRQLIKFCLVLLLVTLPISVSASLCQFCLQPHAIAYQPYPWTGFQQYTWENVSAVTATCRYSRGRHAGWRKQLVLELRDGAAFDLMTWPTAAVRASPAIAQALHGHEFRFDASGVAPGCPEPHLSMLTLRP
jgi:hypothetical protein